MSWVSPRTWVTDEIVTAAQLNEQLRDNTAWLKSSQDSARNYASSSPYSYTGLVGTLDISGASLSYTPKTNQARLIIAVAMVQSGGSILNPANGVMGTVGYKINAGSNNLMFGDGSRLNDGTNLFRTTQTGIAILSVTPNVAISLHATVSFYGYTGAGNVFVYSTRMIVEDFCNV